MCDDNDADEVMKPTNVNFKNHKSQKFQKKFIF